MRTSQWVEFGAAVLATALNLILIPIILTKSSVKMGLYKYFLLVYTITAAVYSYGVSTSLFTWFLPTNGFLFISTVDILPRWLQGLHLAAFCVCYLNTIIILVGSFMYRLSILQNSEPWMVKRRFAPLTIAVLIIPQFSAIFGYICIRPSEQTEAAYKDEVKQALGLDMSRVFYINGELQLLTVWMLSTTGFFFAIGMLICIVYWLRIGSKLKELRNLTNSTYKYHHSIYMLLTLQTCLPLLFYTLPLTIVIIMSFTHISIDGFSHLCAMCLSFAQAIDPLLTIYFVSDYKNFLLRKKAALWHHFGFTSHTVHIFTTERSSTRNGRI